MQENAIYCRKSAPLQINFHASTEADKFSYTFVEMTSLYSNFNIKNEHTNRRYIQSTKRLQTVSDFLYSSVGYIPVTDFKSLQLTKLCLKKIST